MIAMITKLLAQKKGNGADYIRVTFAIKEKEGDENKAQWAKTDLCPTYRNWHFWKDHLVVGATFSVAMKDEKTVDADKPPLFLGMAATVEPPPDAQLGLF